MFTKKIDNNLKFIINNKNIKNFRVIIYYNLKFRSRILNFLEKRNLKIFYTIDELSLISSNCTSRVLELLCTMPEINSVVYDEIVYCPVNTTTYNDGKNIFSKNKLLTPKNFPLTGSNISVGVVSTGIYPHKDFDKYSNIKCFIDLINCYEKPYDDFGIGTALAGIISGSGDSSDGYFRSISPKTSLFICKSFDCTGCSHFSTILYAINYLINNYSLNILVLPFHFPNYNLYSTDHLIRLFNKIKEKKIVTFIPEQKSLLSSINYIDDLIFLTSMNETPNLLLTKPIHLSNDNFTCLNTDKKYKPPLLGKKIFSKKLDAPYTTLNSEYLSLGALSSVTSLILEKKPQYEFKDIYSILRYIFNNEHNLDFLCILKELS